jgi:hypothetical protein
MVLHHAYGRSLQSGAANEKKEVQSSEKNERRLEGNSNDQ